MFQVISNPTTVSLSGHAIPLECVEGRAIMTLLNGDQLDVGECQMPQGPALDPAEITAAVTQALQDYNVAKGSEAEKASNFSEQAAIAASRIGKCCD